MVSIKVGHKKITGIQSTHQLKSSKRLKLNVPLVNDSMISQYHFIIMYFESMSDDFLFVLID